MNSKGKKGKGRVFQQEIRDLLLAICPHGMFQSQPMGVTGTDIIDPSSLLPWRYTECRRWERWPLLADIVEEMRKERSGRWAYVIRRNRARPVWVVPDAVMVDLLVLWLRGIK